MVNTFQSLFKKESELLVKSYVPTKEVIFDIEKKLEQLDLNKIKTNNKYVNVITLSESNENSNGIYNNSQKDKLLNVDGDEEEKIKLINFDFEKPKKTGLENNDVLIKNDLNATQNIFNEHQKELEKRKIKAKRIKKTNLECNDGETHLNGDLMPILNKIEEESNQIEETLNQDQPIETLQLEKTKIKIEQEDEDEVKKTLYNPENLSKKLFQELNLPFDDYLESAQKNENQPVREESNAEENFHQKSKRKRLRLLNNPPSPRSHRKSERLMKKIPPPKPNPPPKINRESDKTPIQDISKKKRQKSKISLPDFFKNKKNFGVKFRKTNCDLFMPHPPSPTTSSFVKRETDSASEVSSVFKDELIPYTKEFNCSLFEKREFFEKNMEEFLVISVEKEVGGREDQEEKVEKKIRKKNKNLEAENQGEHEKEIENEKNRCEILIEEEKVGRKENVVEIDFEEDKERKPDFDGEDRAFGGVRKREWGSWTEFDKFFESLRLS